MFTVVVVSKVNHCLALPCAGRPLAEGSSGRQSTELNSLSEVSEVPL
jgi:hypothetical protein